MPKPSQNHLAVTPSLLRCFWSKVDKRGANDCWLWTGSADDRGYGRLGVKGQSPWLAHRVSWVIHNGPIPKGMNVLHNCPTGDEPGCVNPRHHFLGTLTDNNRDMHAKGRGNSHGWKTRTRCAKGHELTPENTASRKHMPHSRRCRTCDNTAKRVRRQRRRKEAAYE